MEHKKDKNLDSLIRNNVFYGNNLLSYVHKKGVKISKAIYLVTDIIKDTEPLKWSMREVATELVLVKDNQDAKRAALTMGVRIANLKTLVLLANFAKALSDMNTHILVKECDDLLFSIAEIDGFSSDYLSLERDFFSVEYATHPSPFLSVMAQEKAGDKPQFFKGHVKDNNQDMSLSSDSSRIVKKDFTRNAETQILKDRMKSDRTSQIIDIIKSKGEVTIKDISSLIRDCSEKTIQRELLGLLVQDKIKRTGDRRWSKYSLK
jgi:hypothetical protein